MAHQCPSCVDEFPTRAELENHIRTQHSPDAWKQYLASSKASPARMNFLEVRLQAQEDEVQLLGVIGSAQQLVQDRLNELVREVESRLADLKQRSRTSSPLQSTLISLRGLERMVGGQVEATDRTKARVERELKVTRDTIQRAAG